MGYAKWVNYQVAEITWKHHKIRYVVSGPLLTEFNLQNNLLDLLTKDGHHVFIRIDDSYRNKLYYIYAPENKELIRGFLEDHQDFYEISKLLGPLLQIHEHKTIKHFYNSKIISSFKELHETIIKHPPNDSSHDDYFLEKYQTTNIKFPTYYALCKGIYAYSIDVDVYQKLRSILFSMPSVNVIDRPYTDLSSNLHCLTDKNLLTVLFTGESIMPQHTSNVLPKGTLEADDNDEDSFHSYEDSFATNEHYDDDLDMDQQNQEYWDNL